MLLQTTGNRVAQLGRLAHRGHAGLLQGLVLGFSRTLTTGDDGAGMAHALARRRGHAGNVGGHRLADVLGNVFRGFLFSRPPISPTMMMPSVSGSCSNSDRQSTKLMPWIGSPPIPMQV